VLVLDHVTATNVKGSVKQMQKDRCASYVPESLLCEPDVPAPLVKLPQSSDGA
jgi:hypothetical protein